MTNHEAIYQNLPDDIKSEVDRLTPKVVHVSKSKYNAYVGRRNPKIKGIIGEDGRWGNNFTIGKDGDRDDVIEKFKEKQLKNFRESRDATLNIRILRGKTIGCWCKPQDCHGDIIAEAVRTDLIIEKAQELNIDIDKIEPIPNDKDKKSQEPELDFKF